MSNKFIVGGMFRSGTTFLARALNNHEDISFASDPFFEFFKLARNKFFSGKENNFDEAQPLTDYLFQGEVSFEAFHKAFPDLYFNKEDIALLKEKIPRTAAQFSQAVLPFLKHLNPGNTQEIMDQLFEIVEKAYPKLKASSIGFKEVWIEEFAGPLLDQGFKFVHVLRDPRAVIASNKKSITGAYPILFLIRQWRKSVAFAERNRGRKNFHIVKYEDLVTKPQETFSHLCDFIGIPFSEKLIDASSYKDGKGEDWKQNSSFTTSRSINTASIDRWRETLSEQELSIICGLCSHELGLLGYDNRTQYFPIREMLSYNLPEEQVADWIKPYDFTFNRDRIFEEYYLYMARNAKLPLEIPEAGKAKIFHLN